MLEAVTIKQTIKIGPLCDKGCNELVLARVICSHVALQEERKNIKESAQWSINFQLGNPVCKPAVQPNADCLPACWHQRSM